MIVLIDFVYYDNMVFLEWNNKLLMILLKDEMFYVLEMDFLQENVVGVFIYFFYQFGRLRDVVVDFLKCIYLVINFGSVGM